MSCDLLPKIARPNNERWDANNQCKMFRIMMVYQDFCELTICEQSVVIKALKIVSFFDAFSIYNDNNIIWCMITKFIWLCAWNDWDSDMLSYCAECANDLCVTTDCVHRNHKSFERLIICLFVFACHPFQVNIAFRELARRKVHFNQQISDFLFYSQCFFFLSLPLFSGIFGSNV